MGRPETAGGFEVPAEHVGRPFYVLQHKLLGGNLGGSWWSRFRRHWYMVEGMFAGAWPHDCQLPTRWVGESPSWREPRADGVQRRRAVAGVRGERNEHRPGAGEQRNPTCSVYHHLPAGRPQLIEEAVAVASNFITSLIKTATRADDPLGDRHVIRAVASPVVGEQRLPGRLPDRGAGGGGGGSDQRCSATGPLSSRGVRPPAGGTRRAVRAARTTGLSLRPGDRFHHRRGRRHGRHVLGRAAQHAALAAAGAETQNLLVRMLRDRS